MESQLLTAFLIVLPLLSPRQAETFKGTQMARLDAITPSAIVLPPPSDRMTNSFTWTGSAGADGYRLYQYSGSLTNIYDTGETKIQIVYSWPANVERWFYSVTATNEWGESDPSNRLHDPPYPNDRMDLWVNGVSAFNLQASADRKTWTGSMVTGRATVSLLGFNKYYRVQGKTNRLEFIAYNPLNE